MQMEKFVFKSKVRVAISGVCNLHCQYCDNSHVSSADRIIAMEDFRSTPLYTGVISVSDYLQILSAFYRNDFKRINLTGGEPMLNPQWDIIVDEAKKIGFDSVEMTTNGALIKHYLDQKPCFPSGLDRLIVSIDTCDAQQYCEIVGGGVNLSDIIKGIQLLRKTNPNLKLTANCVLTRTRRIEMQDYIDFICDAGFDSITFLDLVIRDPRDKQEVAFFLDEFLSGKELKADIYQRYGDLEVRDGRHDYNVTLPNGINISIIDTQGLTRRDEACKQCKHYCQEGFYTAKIATDGTIIDCLGEGGISINAIKALKQGTLDSDIQKLYQRLALGKPGYHFNEFYHKLLENNTM